ncbi:MAG: transposase [Candidatus Binatia bacterium]
MTNKTIDTRFGQLTLSRWFFQNTLPGEPGIAPLDLRLGLFAGRMTPGLAEVTGRLAADMPQQMVLEVLQERFHVTPGVGTLRRVVGDLAEQVRAHHDQAAIERLSQLMKQARHSKGKHEPLLQVGRDGVYVQTRPCWEEASCGTLAVYDRSRRRLGTVYLGQMPESDQPTMTARLTTVITGTLVMLGSYVPRLRYVTDAGSLQQSYFRKVLAPMKHPENGQQLKWSWGVDFYHACEYVSKLAAALFGSGDAASAWAAKQRQTLRTKAGGVARVIQSAAQRKRRHGLKGATKDYASAVNYLDNHRAHMDFATRRRTGDPIGSGITEAGCKVIFNQRLKQSGMRWHAETGQRIVDLRTAVRGGIWQTVWQRILTPPDDLPPIARQQTKLNRKNSRKKMLLTGLLQTFRSIPIGP